MSEPIVRLRGVRKTFWRDREPVPVLDGLDLDVPEGSFEALMGPSGSGKTTLLNLIAGLDRPTEGSIEVAGQPIHQLPEGALARWRSETIGFVFQSYNLLPVLTAQQNVELPLLLRRLPRAERRKRAETALRIVGLEDRTQHFPRQLSGGQEQRVTIARAIVNDPKILVADEPTGNLDKGSTKDVLDLLARLNKELGKTILMVTHDPHAAERATIIRKLDKGQLA
ncbi:MAG: ABC transporter ATP-binding protein [Planctomycetales bacterium]|nr:ABC transporter ATP-binding protein [Planctomycetales bacterium]